MKCFEDYMHSTSLRIILLFASVFVVKSQLTNLFIALVYCVMEARVSICTCIYF